MGVCVWLELIFYRVKKEESIGREQDPRALWSAGEFCLYAMFPFESDLLLYLINSSPLGRLIIRGAKSKPLILFNTSVTMCFTDRSYLCHVLHSSTLILMLQTERTEVVHEMDDSSWKQDLRTIQWTHNWPQQEEVIVPGSGCGSFLQLKQLSFRLYSFS